MTKKPNKLIEWLKTPRTVTLPNVAYVVALFCIIVVVVTVLGGGQ